MLSNIPFQLHTHAEAAISIVHLATCPHNGEIENVGRAGCITCGGSGVKWENSKHHFGNNIKYGTGYEIKFKENVQGATLYRAYRCSNCGDDGDYDCKQYAEEIGILAIYDNGSRNFISRTGTASEGSTYVPIRECKHCCDEIHNSADNCTFSNPVCFSVAKWAVPHIKQAEKYTITVNTNPANAGTTLGSGSYDNGTILNINATANSGWTFAGWADDASASSSRQVFVTQDKTYTANFVTSTPTPTPKPDDVYIETRVGEGEGTTTGDGYYPKSSTATARINAIPADGYEFVGWKIYKKADNSLLDERTQSSTTVITNYDKYAVADFKPEDEEVIVTTSSDPVKGGTTTGGGIYKKGDSVTVTATANKDYEFVQWLINGVPQEEGKTSITFTVQKDTDCIAIFNEEGMVTFTIVAAPQDGGTVRFDYVEGGYTPSGGTVRVPKGTRVEFSATPNDDHEFKYWQSDSGVKYTETSGTAKPQKNMVYTAFFSGGDDEPTPTPTPEMILTDSKKWEATITLDPNGGTYLKDYNTLGKISEPPYDVIKTQSWWRVYRDEKDTHISWGSSGGHNSKESKAYKTPYMFAGYGLNEYWKNCLGTGMVFDANGQSTGSRFFDEQGTSTFMLNGEYTIYAVWLPTLYEMIYLAPGAQGSMDPSTIEYGLASPLSKNKYEIPTTLNYNINTSDINAILHSTPQVTVYAPFLGWAKTPNGGVVYIDQQYVSHEIYPADTYTMTLYARFGTPMVTLPTAERYGYQFMGWKANNMGEIIPAGTTLPAMEGMTYYAQWRPNEYTISFDANGGTSSFQKKIVYHDGTYGTLPTATKTGYDFVEWTYKMNVSITESSPLQVNKDHELIAIWSPKRFKLYVDPNGGTVNGRDSLHEYGTLTYMSNDLYSIQPPQRIGHNFLEYNTKPDGTGATVYDKNGQAVISNYFDSNTKYINLFSLTVYALWEIQTYKIRFDANGGDCSVKDMMVQYGDTYGTLPVPTRRGARFVGWTYETTPINDNDPLAVCSDHTLVAQWEKIPITVTFVWNFNYNRPGIDTHTGLPPYINSKIVEFGEPYGDLPTPSREGYLFLGWRLEQNERGNGSGTAITTATVVDIESDHFLYAQWEQATYELTFDYNDEHLH